MNKCRRRLAKHRRNERRGYRGRLEALRSRLLTIGRAEGGSMFAKRPDRWWDRFTVRCPNDHVSTAVLSTDRGDACLVCFDAVTLTFPEDSDGPLRRKP